MTEQFLLFLVLLIAVAAVIRQDFAFTIVYLFAGAFILGSWWSRKSLANVAYKRCFDQRAFLNEKIIVELEVSNSGLLPVVWLRINESLPVDLTVRPYFRRVLTLGPRKSARYTYELNARKRGYYSVGPLFAYTGDLLGLLKEQASESPSDFLIVYPRIVPLSSLKLPSSSPMGTLRHVQPIFEDPTRVIGKRNYVSGDSLRRVDWKSTAASGRLQVKQFEPSIALETAIFLDLNAEAYDLKTRFVSTELAIIIAASIANWTAGRKQPVGLVTNGLDPLAAGFEAGKTTGITGMAIIQSIPPRKGRSHLMRILDALARVQTGQSFPLIELLSRECINLTWGTTTIIITESIDENFFDQLFQLRRTGLNVVLILTGQGEAVRAMRRRCISFGFACYQVNNEQDMDIWRQ
jgi:uncharacterized protein (DUF58 family)